MIRISPNSAQPRFGGTFTFKTGAKYPPLHLHEALVTIQTKPNSRTVITIEPDMGKKACDPKVRQRWKDELRRAERNLDRAYLSQCRTSKVKCHYQGPLIADTEDLSRLVKQFSAPLKDHAKSHKNKSCRS